ncbi:hypothetical protein [Maridesulfovibrio bastinii]|jgi:hypothetical protein|uniref:hypothetical protein n=1 Tax=Maridesulfovibrio bastinii TaxID=47157 RepID=UPI00041781C0|nr:hypothetical protein [Maridesulfovibrio bastinii]
MSLPIRLLTLSAGAAIAGLAVYAVIRPEKIRPAVVETIKGGIKAKDWACDKFTSAKKEVSSMVDEAKSGDVPAASVE